MTPEEKARFREQIAAIPAAPGGSVPRCAHCGRDVEEKIDPDMGGNHHRWWVHVPGGYTPCNPQLGARSTKAEPAPVGGLRERIREAAAEVWRDGLGGMTEADVLDRYAAALLPVVEAHTAEETARLRDDRDRLAAEVAELRVSRGRYRSAWQSARERAQSLSEGIERLCRDRDSWKGWLRTAEAEVRRLTDLVGQYADRGIANGERADKAEAAVARVLAACTRLAPEQPDPIETAVAYGEGWNAALDAVQAALGNPAVSSANSATWTAVRAIQLMNEAGAKRDTAEATVARVRAECDRLEAAVRANPQSPDFDEGYLAPLRWIRAALDGTGEASC